MDPYRNHIIVASENRLVVNHRKGTRKIIGPNSALPKNISRPYRILMLLLKIQIDSKFSRASYENCTLGSLVESTGGLSTKWLLLTTI